LPTISSFFGIVIRMYFEEHGVAHFHAYYGGDEAVIAIESLDTLQGRLPRRALAMVVEWALEHRPELKDNWERAAQHLPLAPIAPLQ
jgi:hypothetical protein